VWQREHLSTVSGTERVDHDRAVEGMAARAIERRRQLRAPRSVNDGNGFVFIDHLGNVCPSGFLPAPRGNVRADDLIQIYRRDELFGRLRNPNALLGKCGRCQFRAICGGSRSRAFAATGAVMASDPLCVYEPGPGVAPLVSPA
jgi:AdoMet-dependent heme synthase